jgi:hypothetical protein
MRKSHHVLQIFIVIALTCLISACGGSSSGVTIVDSFGRIVIAEGGDSVGDGDAGVDGTAGDGAPIVGGRIQITDANGKSVTAISDKEGYYRAKVTGFTPPFMVNLVKTTGEARYSLNVTPIKVNGFVNLNISGLTTKIASDVALAAGKNGPAELTPQLLASNAAAIDNSLAEMRIRIAPVIEQAGLNPASFNPLNVPFRADHTGYDYVLDNTWFYAQSGFYAGTYSCLLSGSDTGAFTATVDGNGRLNAVGTTAAGGSVTGAAQVSPNGTLADTFGGPADGPHFSGSFSTSRVISGTWTHALVGWSGTFTCS